MEGWIKIHRKILEWGWFVDSYVYHIFSFCLLKANIEDTVRKGINIKAGSFITSVDSISKSTGITGQSIRTALNKLKSTNELTIKTTNKYTLITVVQWEEYQLGTHKLTSKSTSKLTNNQQTTNKQLTTDKEYKKKEEEKTLDIPEHLINNFTAFVEYRKASKKPMTEHAQKLLLENVLKLGKTEAQQNKILEKSIMNGWQGIFPLKEEECCDDPIIFKKMYDNGNIDMLKKNLGLDKYFELKSSLPIL